MPAAGLAARKEARRTILLMRLLAHIAGAGIVVIGAYRVLVDVFPYLRRSLGSNYGAEVMSVLLVAGLTLLILEALRRVP